MPKDSNLEKHVLEGDSVEQKAMKKEEEKEMTDEERETEFLKEVGQKDYSKYSKEELWNLSDEEWVDWFAWSERKRYEEGLEQPTPFPIKVHNWIVTMEEKIKFFIDSYRLRRLIANYRWNHGGRERYDKYMMGVHECYDRARKKEAEEKRGVKENNRQV